MQKDGSCSTAGSCGCSRASASRVTTAHAFCTLRTTGTDSRDAVRWPTSYSSDMAAPVTLFFEIFLRLNTFTASLFVIV